MAGFALAEALASFALMIVFCHRLQFENLNGEQWADRSTESDQLTSLISGGFRQALDSWLFTDPGVQERWHDILEHHVLSAHQQEEWLIMIVVDLGGALQVRLVAATMIVCSVFLSPTSPSVGVFCWGLPLLPKSRHCLLAMGQICLLTKKRCFCHWRVLVCHHSYGNNAFACWFRMCIN